MITSCIQFTSNKIDIVFIISLHHYRLLIQKCLNSGKIGGRQQEGWRSSGQCLGHWELTSWKQSVCHVEKSKETEVSQRSQKELVSQWWKSGNTEPCEPCPAALKGLEQSVDTSYMCLNTSWLCEENKPEVGKSRQTTENILTVIQGSNLDI